MAIPQASLTLPASSGLYAKVSSTKLFVLVQINVLRPLDTFQSQQVNLVLISKLQGNPT